MAAVRQILKPWYVIEPSVTQLIDEAPSPLGPLVASPEYSTPFTTSMSKPDSVEK